MKKVFGLALMTIMLTNGFSQQRVNQCGYIIPKKSIFRTNFKSVYEARDVVTRMLDTIKWRENFTLQEKNGIQNAYATIINNKRWIIYDNEFLESIDEYAATKWASISVMAHEVGHHKHNHVFTGKGSTIPTEIEADDFSGYVMQKLGATLDESVAAIKTISTEKASSTHPAKKDRVAAITRGWQRAAAEKPGTGGGASTGTGTKPPVGTSTGGTKPPTGTGTPSGGGTKPTGGGTTNNPPADQDYIILTMTNIKQETIYMSDDGKNFQPLVMEPNKPFPFTFEIYKWGWLRLPHYNSYRIYKLLHGKDYTIVFNYRTQNWTVVETPE
jgi:hypothetical protein